MVGLQVILILHHEHVVISHQMIGLIRNRVIQLIIKVIVAVVVLLRRLQDVLDLGFEFQLFLQLLLLVHLVHYLLIFH